MSIVYVSIGSNIERQHNIRSGVNALHETYGELIVSTVYESAAEGFAGDPFYNLVAGFKTGAGPFEVNETLHAIENNHGRKRGQEKFSSRTLDLDLLLFGEQNLQERGLDIPRAEILQYAFILWPLVEIAPNFIHPVEKVTIENLWQAYQSGHKAQLATIRPVEFNW